MKINSSAESVVFLCIKTFVMDDGTTAFTMGRRYIFSRHTGTSWVTQADDQDDIEHVMDDYLMLRHFVEVDYIDATWG